jgi:hypothetical protein
MMLIKDTLVDKIILVFCAIAVFPLIWLFLAL